MEDVELVDSKEEGSLPDYFKVIVTSKTVYKTNSKRDIVESIVENSEPNKGEKERFHS